MAKTKVRCRYCGAMNTDDTAQRCRICSGVLPDAAARQKKVTQGDNFSTLVKSELDAWRGYTEHTFEVPGTSAG